ncbi:MAG TPA: DinB family protein [Actinomycetota bacterium]
MAEREILSLEPLADAPEVGRWLSALEDGRRDTLRELEGVPDEALEWEVDERTNTLGTLLYHVALVEDDWLWVDVFEAPEHPKRPIHLFPFPDRIEGQRLTPVTGFTLAEHLERLAVVRSLLLEMFRPMTVEDFLRLRHGERYDVSPAWVLHHIAQHEAEHRSQIFWVRDAWRASQG